MSGKKQHHIPRALLKGFANEREQVTVFRSNRVHQTNIRKVGAVNHDFPREIDDYITEVEYEQHDFLKSLDTDRVLSPEENKLVNEMLAFWRFRNYEMYKFAHDYILKGIEKIKPNRMPFDIDFESIAKKALGEVRPSFIDGFRKGKRKYNWIWHYELVNEPLILGDMVFVSHGTDGYKSVLSEKVASAILVPVHTYGILIGESVLGSYSLNIQEINEASAANSYAYYISNSEEIGRVYYRVFCKKHQVRNEEASLVVEKATPINFYGEKGLGFFSQSLNKYLSEIDISVNLEQTKTILKYYEIFGKLKLDSNELQETIKAELESDNDEYLRILVIGLWAFFQIIKTMLETSESVERNVYLGVCKYIAECDDVRPIYLFEINGAYLALTTLSKIHISVGEFKRILIDSRLGYFVLDDYENFLNNI